MNTENKITASGVISFLIDRKEILYCVISCLIGLIVLFFGMFMCDKSFWNYMFTWIIPGAGIVLLGVYAVSMTDKHPIILIFPSIIFFSSLFIRFLVTYDYLTFTLILIQSVPFLVFWVSIIKKSYYKETHLAISVAIISVICMLLAIITVNILDHCSIISLPMGEHLLLEMLVYVEIATACMYYGIGFLNKDLQLEKTIKET